MNALLKKQPLYKYIRKNKNFLVFFGLVFLGLASTLYVEYKFQYEQFRWLEWRVFVISIAVVLYGALPQGFRRKNNKKLYLILGLTALLYFLNLLANLLNVYHLDKFPAIVDFCTRSAEVCISIGENFFRYKVYRFVSLTSYFFMYVIFLIIGLLFSEKIYERIIQIWARVPLIHIKKVKINKVKLRYVLLFYFLVVYILAQQLIFVFSAISKKIVRMYSTVQIPYGQRWEQVMGGRFSFGWMKTYSEFVNEQSPDDSVLLIPNREAPWEMEGNPHYLRWFIYPRGMVQMFESTEIPADADYALLTYGVFGYKKETFPNFFISREKIDEIIFVNQNTLEVTRKENIDFRPEEYENVWGLIKLRK